MYKTLKGCLGFLRFWEAGFGVMVGVEEEAAGGSAAWNKEEVAGIVVDVGGGWVGFCASVLEFFFGMFKGVVELSLFFIGILLFNYIYRYLS